MRLSCQTMEQGYNSDLTAVLTTLHSDLTAVLTTLQLRFNCCSNYVTLRFNCCSNYVIRQHNRVCYVASVLTKLSDTLIQQ